MKKYERRKMISAGAAAFCLFMAAHSLWSGMQAEARESESVTFGECWLKTIGSKEAVGNIPSGFTVEDVFIERNDKAWRNEYFQFTLPEDAWVYLTGRYTDNNHDGIQTHVKIFSDKAMTNMVGEFGWGYWEYDGSFSGDLKRGTYYGVISSKYANYDDFAGDIDIFAAEIPSGKHIDAAVKKAKNKKTATITVADKTGEPTGYVEYVKGNVKKTIAVKPWKDAKQIPMLEGICSFKVDQDGIYSIRMQDASGCWHLKRVRIKGLKP